MTATPETFKPGERWLQAGFCGPIEVVCVEWAPSGKWVKILTVSVGKADWVIAEVTELYAGGERRLNTIELLERLPDEKQSGSNQAEPARGTEAAGFYGICAYLNGEEVARLSVAARGFASLWLFAQVVEEAARVRSQSNGDGVD